MPVLMRYNCRMRRSLFFKVFPPPRFLVKPYVGLDISDDALTAIFFHEGSHGLTVSYYVSEPLPPSLVDGGDMKDEGAFADILTTFARKHGITCARVSLPEEKTYLFETDVPNTDRRSLYDNIESKLEENVPLSPQDALFNFSLLPSPSGAFSPHASVSVIPRTYIDRYLGVLRRAGIECVGFEVVPRALAAAVVPAGSTSTDLIVHVMRGKTGLYIAASGAVAFASTVAWGADLISQGGDDIARGIMRDIGRVYAYWSPRVAEQGKISRVVLSGLASESLASIIRTSGGSDIPSPEIANVWTNAFDTEEYVPPISHADSTVYGVAAGLALPF